MKKANFKVLVPAVLPDLNLHFKKHRWIDEIFFIFLYLINIATIMRRNRNYAPGISRDAGWIPVLTKDLKVVLHDRYRNHLNWLMKMKIIELDRHDDGRPKYLPKVYSMKYRILYGNIENQDRRKYRIEHLTHPKVLTLVHSFYNTNYNVARKEFLKLNAWYEPNLLFTERLYLDDAALEFAQKQPRRSDNLISGMSLFNGKIGRFVERDSFAGRIHHFGGVLDKDLRPYLRIEGSNEPLSIADIHCCQAYLLSVLFRYEHLLDEILPEFKPVTGVIEMYRSKPDVKIFFEDCCSGEFMKRWMFVTNLKKPQAKVALFRHILYSAASNHHRSKKVRAKRMKYRFAFQSIYPGVFKILQKLKRTKKESLPEVQELSAAYKTPNMMAQRLESRLLLDRLTMRLNEKGIISMTIHDAWVFPTKYREEFEKEFQELFRELKIKPPKIEITDLEITPH